MKLVHKVESALSESGFTAWDGTVYSDNDIVDVQRPSGTQANVVGYDSKSGKFKTLRGFVGKDELSDETVNELMARFGPKEMNESLETPVYTLSEEEQAHIGEFAESIGAQFMSDFTESLIDVGLDTDGGEHEVISKAAQAAVVASGFSIEDFDTPAFEKAWEAEYDRISAEREKNGDATRTAVAQQDARTKALFALLRGYC